MSCSSVAFSISAMTLCPLAVKWVKYVMWTFHGLNRVKASCSLHARLHICKSEYAHNNIHSVKRFHVTGCLFVLNRCKSIRR